EAAAQLGALLVRAGRVLEGTAHLRAALGANPLQPLANFTLGQLMANNGRIAEARQHFERALQGHPDEAQALEIRRALDLLGPLKRRLKAAYFVMMPSVFAPAPRATSIRCIASP